MRKGLLRTKKKKKKRKVAEHEWQAVQTPQLPALLHTRVRGEVRQLMSVVVSSSLLESGTNTPKKRGQN